MEKDETFVPTELKMRATAKLEREVKKELADKDKKETSIKDLINGQAKKNNSKNQ